MSKKQVKLNESDLKNIIRNTVARFINENVDELSPEFLIHAAHKAVDDKKNYPGRGKNSTDPAMRAKRDRQAKAFGDEAANRINQDINDPDFMAIGDRGARRMMYAKGPHSAYLTNDLEDIDAARLYNDDFKDGDEPMTIADLPDDEYQRVHSMFDKFKGYHDRAKELDSRLEEKVNRIVDSVIKESFEWNFGIDPAAKMLYVSAEVEGGFKAFDPTTKKKAFVPAEEVLSHNPEEVIRVSAKTYNELFA